MRAYVIGVIVLAGCPKPPPPPSVNEPPRLAAEESCATPTPLPSLPGRFPANPYAISHPAEIYMVVDGVHLTPQFLCDLPDQILGIGATQTVEGGKRVVGGAIYAHARVPTARALPEHIEISPSSPGCKPGELACAFETSSPAITKIDMLRQQWINTSGWVHGMDDMCRALPDDTIAVCSTRTRMAYVELGCDGALSLGVHDASLARRFDLDVESPVMRRRGSLDAAPPDAKTWTFRFENATLEMEVRPAVGDKGPVIDSGWSNLHGTLAIDGASEPCIAWAIYRH